jgi:hypothetical protein
MINKFRHLLSVGVALHVYKVNHQEIFSKPKQREEENDEDLNLRGRGLYSCKNGEQHYT